MNLDKKTYLSGIRRVRVAIAPEMSFEIVRNKLKSYSSEGELYEIYFTKDTGELKSSSQARASGIVRRKTLEIYYPGINIDTIRLLDELIGQQLIVEVTTRENNIYIIGTPSQPLKISYEYDSGRSMSDESGYSITFQATQKITLVKSDAPL